MNKIKNIELKLKCVEIRAKKDDNNAMVVSGYVNMTEELSEVLGSGQKFREKIKKGAFKEAIQKNKNIDFLIEHDEQKIIASTANNSLTLTEDEKGLYMEAELTPTSYAKDYYELVKSGIVKNLSFGFRALKEKWENIKGETIRTIEDLELFEVSIVRNPAYAQSVISARGLALSHTEIPKNIEEENDLENSNELVELLLGLESKILKIEKLVDEIANDKYCEEELEKPEEESENREEETEEKTEQEDKTDEGDPSEESETESNESDPSEEETEVEPESDETEKSDKNTEDEDEAETRSLKIKEELDSFRKQLDGFKEEK